MVTAEESGDVIMDDTVEAYTQKDIGAELRALGVSRTVHHGDALTWLESFEFKDVM